VLDPTPNIVAALISFAHARVSIRPQSGRSNCPIVSAVNTNGEIGGDNSTIMFANIPRIEAGAINGHAEVGELISREPRKDAIRSRRTVPELAAVRSSA